MRWGITFVLLSALLASGCLGEPGPVDTHIRAGERAIWSSVIAREGVVVDAGGYLEITGTLYTSRAVTVRGTLVARNATFDFDDAPDESVQIIVEGGSVELADVTQRGGPTEIRVTSAGSLTWTKGTLLARSIQVLEGSAATFEGVRLISGVEQAAVEAADATVRIVNSSIEGLPLRASTGGVIRAVNVGIQLDRLQGAGLVERAWTARVRVEQALGPPVPGVNVTARAALGGEVETSSTTGADGVAYFEIVEIAMRNDLPEVRTPHRFSTTTGESVAAVNAPEEEIVLFQIDR